MTGSSSSYRRGLSLSFPSLLWRYSFSYHRKLSRTTPLFHDHRSFFLFFFFSPPSAERPQRRSPVPFSPSFFPVVHDPVSPPPRPIRIAMRPQDLSYAVVHVVLSVPLFSLRLFIRTLLFFFFLYFGHRNDSFARHQSRFFLLSSKGALLFFFFSPFPARPLPGRARAVTTTVFLTLSRLKADHSSLSPPLFFFLFRPRRGSRSFLSLPPLPFCREHPASLSRDTFRRLKTRVSSFFPFSLGLRSTFPFFSPFPFFRRQCAKPEIGDLQKVMKRVFSSYPSPFRKRSAGVSSFFSAMKGTSIESGTLPWVLKEKTRALPLLFFFPSFFPRPLSM